MNLNELQKSFVFAMAECDMSVSEVARKMHYHRNTAEYHLNCVYRKTGLNPKRFYDLAKLISAFEGKAE